jgi:hypothetical protein
MLGKAAARILCRKRISASHPHRSGIPVVRAGPFVPAAPDPADATGETVAKSLQRICASGTVAPCGA